MEGAQFLQGNPVIMTKEAIYQTHMKAVNHYLLTRKELKRF